MAFTIRHNAEKCKKGPMVRRRAYSTQATTEMLASTMDRCPLHLIVMELIASIPARGKSADLHLLNLVDYCSIFLALLSLLQLSLYSGFDSGATQHRREQRTTQPQ